MIKNISKILFWVGFVLVLIGGVCYNSISGDATLDTIKLLIECDTLLMGGICLMIYSYNMDILRKINEIEKLTNNQLENWKGGKK